MDDQQIIERVDVILGRLQAGDAHANIAAHVAARNQLLRLVREAQIYAWKEATRLQARLNKAAAAAAVVE